MNGRRVWGGDAPDPELAEKAKRRRFSARYKLEILQAADACTKHGEVGALLRREGLYTSHLSAWRKQRDEGALHALSKSRGRPKSNPLDGERGATAAGRAGGGGVGVAPPGESSSSRSAETFPCTSITLRALVPGNDPGCGGGTQSRNRHPTCLPGVKRGSGNDLPAPAASSAEAEAGAVPLVAPPFAHGRGGGPQDPALRAVRGQRPSPGGRHPAG